MLNKVYKKPKKEKKDVSKLFFLTKCTAYIGHRFFKIVLIHHQKTIKNIRK